LQNESSNSVNTAEIAMEPNRPSRLLKNKNMRSTPLE
jgi:hypothetical protein